MSLLKICAWNANGVSQHKQEIYNFLRNEEIDLMLISETHLTYKNNFSVSGYKFYKTNHPDGKAHGGTGILIRNRIKHFCLEPYSKTFLQATSIQLQNEGKNLTVSAVYCPPRFAISENEFKEFFDTLGDRFLAAGDYNAKHNYWGSRLINPKGKQLYNLLINNPNTLDFSSPGQPTYWPSDHSKIPDLIDFAITKGINRNLITAENKLDLSSDHSPILFCILEKPLSTESPLHLTTHKTNWLKYKKYISAHIHTNYTIECKEHIDDAVTVINDILISAANASTPLNPNKTCSPKYFTNSEIQSLVSEKRRLRRVWQQNRSPEAHLRLKTAERKLKAALSTEKEKSQFDFISNLSPNNINKSSLWKTNQSMKPPVESEHPIRTSTGDWARSDEEKANVFAQHLSLVFQPNPSSSNHSPPQPHTNTDIINTHITPSDVVSAIQTKLKNKKAPGYDSITPNMLKNLPYSAIIFITRLFNAIIDFGYFPSDWKKSLIIMILKPGKDPTLASSYRPISLLPCLSKLFEKIFLIKLTPYLQEHELIPTHQFGFREKHGTIEQVNRITNEIRSAFEFGEYCSAIFLDVAQAFDKVWHEGLIHKIRCLLPQNVHAVLESYLTNRLFRVRHKSYISSDFQICAGVPQGSVLGPLLYVLFTSDIPTSNQLVTSTFADDTAILSRHKNVAVATTQLESHLLLVNNWLSQWRIKVNEQKCRHVTFTLNRSPPPAVSLNNIRIPQADNVTYLGIHLDKRLTWRKHIEAKKTQMKLKASKLHWLLNSRSPLKLEHKVLLYNQVIKPIWTYGLQLYGYASASNIELLQRAQSKILRTITGAPWFVKNENIHRDLQIPMVKTEFQKSRNKYTEKLNNHVNPLARHLANLTGHSRLRRSDRPAIQLALTTARGSSFVDNN